MKQLTKKYLIKPFFSLFKPLLRFLAIGLIKFLQNKYKSMSMNNRHNQSNQVIAKLILIQSILYFFKKQFQAWGYFHPDCIWSIEDEEYFRKLFPTKDFEELDIVVWHNPEAINYYQNKIFKLTKEKPPAYEIEIKNQLKDWKDWN